MAMPARAQQSVPSLAGQAVRYWATRTSATERMLDTGHMKPAGVLRIGQIIRIATRTGPIVLTVRILAHIMAQMGMDMGTTIGGMTDSERVFAYHAGLTLFL